VKVVSFPVGNSIRKGPDFPRMKSGGVTPPPPPRHGADPLADKTSINERESTVIHLGLKI